MQYLIDLAKILCSIVLAIMAGLNLQMIADSKTLEPSAKAVCVILIIVIFVFATAGMFNKRTR